MTSNLPNQATPVELLGISSAIQGVTEEIRCAARSDAKVLITGESGVGKEIVARLIHRQSSRTAGPLVTINCGGFPDSLLETEMFGHVKGSFTDAHRDKRGWLDMAHGGTIFMDEVGEMSLRMQALLLRFLESGEVQRVGEDKRTAPLNVRVITATHRRLLERVAEKSFREDLYYRLNVIHIEVPALRERVEDIPLLASHFLRECAAAHGTEEPVLTAGALRSLSSYYWPGNVRELKNVAERLVVGQRTNTIDVHDLPSEVLLGRRSSVAVPGNGEGALRPVARTLFDRMVVGGESFWAAVYDPFIAHDLTRADLREVVRLGLVHTRGSYKILAASLNVPPADYKRFMAVLRRYHCHLPFQGFRMLKSDNLDVPEQLGESAEETVPAA